MDATQTSRRTMLCEPDAISWGWLPGTTAPSDLRPKNSQPAHLSLTAQPCISIGWRCPARPPNVTASGFYTLPLASRCNSSGLSHGVLLGCFRSSARNRFLSAECIKTEASKRDNWTMVLAIRWYRLLKSLLDLRSGRAVPSYANGSSLARMVGRYSETVG